MFYCGQGKTERLGKQQSKRKRMPRQKTDRDNRGRNQDQESEGQKVKARGEKKGWERKREKCLGLPGPSDGPGSSPSAAITISLSWMAVTNCSLEPTASTRQDACKDWERWEEGEEEAEEKGGTFSIVCSPIGPVREGAGTGGVKGGIKRVPVTGALS